MSEGAPLLGRGTWIQPGPATLVVRESGWALMVPGLKKEVIEAAWTALGDEPTAEGFLDDLVQAAGLESLDKLPAILYALVDGTTAHVGVKGKTPLAVYTSEGARQIAGTEDEPLARETIEGVRRIAFGDLPPEEPTGGLRLEAGISRVRGFVQATIDPSELDDEARAALAEQVEKDGRSIEDPEAKKRKAEQPKPPPPTAPAAPSTPVRKPMLATRAPGAMPPSRSSSAPSQAAAPAGPSVFDDLFGDKKDDKRSDAAPAPAASNAPAPAPEPAPSPDPAPGPDPVPGPEPAPASEPTPAPGPEAKPAVAPAPSAEPAQGPAPFSESEPAPATAPAPGAASSTAAPAGPTPSEPASKPDRPVTAEPAPVPAAPAATAPGKRRLVSTSLFDRKRRAPTPAAPTPAPAPEPAAAPQPTSPPERVAAPEPAPEPAAAPEPASRPQTEPAAAPGSASPPEPATPADAAPASSTSPDVRRPASPAPQEAPTSSIPTPPEPDDDESPVTLIAPIEDEHATDDAEDDADTGTDKETDERGGTSADAPAGTTSGGTASSLGFGNDLDATGAYDDLFGKTVFRRIEDAAVRRTDEDEDSEEAGSSSETAPTEPDQDDDAAPADDDTPETLAQPAQPTADAASSAIGGDFIDWVPGVGRAAPEIAQTAARRASQPPPVQPAYPQVHMAERPPAPVVGPPRAVAPSYGSAPVPQEGIGFPQGAPQPAGPAAAGPGPARPHAGTGQEGHPSAPRHTGRVASAPHPVAPSGPPPMPAPSPAPAAGADPRPAAPAHAGSAAPGGQQAARTVVIPGLLCPHGHPNCPERTLCRTCGGPLEQKTRPVHRPPLGTVEISTGGGFVLDRSAVIGRRPRASRVSADDVPQLVTVPSPQQDISRSHLELRLEGWRVIALDMGTTNGTTLERPGMEPVRLRAGEGVVLGEGDRLDLGDGVRLTMRGMA